MKAASSLLALGLVSAVSAFAAPIIQQAASPDRAVVAASVDEFRNALGTLNPNQPVNFPGGRRQIDWDAVPDAVSAPGNFAGDFFNQNFAGRARGIEFSGSTFQVSANAGAGVDFANLNPEYANNFENFSPNKLFTPVSSNITDISFFSPAETTRRASVTGFGAVFSDVDLANTTSIEFFDLNDASLGFYYVPNSPGDATFSFFGLYYNDGTQIGRIRITTGTFALGTGASENLANGMDAVAMDDFIYAEPSPVPEPGTWAMLATGIVGLGVARWKRRTN